MPGAGTVERSSALYAASTGRRCCLQATDRDHLSELAMTAPEGEHYQHAPIHEAILEFRVSGVERSRLDALRSVVEVSGFQEPAADYDVKAEVGFEGDNLVSNAEQTLVGYRAVREDGQRAVRATVNLFSFSWLRPYDRWESFVGEALQLWSGYEEAASPTDITRVSVRFINRINIPRQSVEIKDYLRTAVDISPYLPQALNGFFLQLDIPLSKSDATTRVISTIVQPESPDSTSLILDLDTWRSVDVDLAADGAQALISSHLNDLRGLKNYVFEACITDATRGLIR